MRITIDHTEELYWEVASACETLEGLAEDADGRPETDRRRGLGLHRVGRAHERP